MPIFKLILEGLRAFNFAISVPAGWRASPWEVALLRRRPAAGTTSRPTDRRAVIQASFSVPNLQRNTRAPKSRVPPRWAVSRVRPGGAR